MYPSGPLQILIDTYWLTVMSGKKELITPYLAENFKTESHGIMDGKKIVTYLNNRQELLETISKMTEKLEGANQINKSYQLTTDEMGNKVFKVSYKQHLNLVGNKTMLSEGEQTWYFEEQNNQIILTAVKVHECVKTGQQSPTISFGGFVDEQT